MTLVGPERTKTGSMLKANHHQERLCPDALPDPAAIAPDSGGGTRRSIRLTSMVLWVALAIVVTGCGSSHKAAAHAAKAIWCPTRFGLGPGGIPSHLGVPNRRVKNSFDVRTVVGMSRSAAAAYVEQRGCSLRVVAIEGGGPLTLNTNAAPDRVDVEVAHGRVIAVGVW